MIYVARGATELTSVGARHDAICEGAVAALGYLHPRLEGALSPHRQVAGEPLELEVTLRLEVVRAQELREPVDLARSECHVHERELLEDALLERLRPAPADPDDARWVF